MQGARGKRLLTVAAGDPPEPAAFVSVRLGLPLEAATRLVREGGVFIGPRRLTAQDAPLRPGTRLTVFVEGGEPARAEVAAAPPAVRHAPARASAQAPGQAPAVRVVYSDAELVIADKPAGLPSQPGRRGGPSLLTALPAELGTLHLLHRLDSEASGLVILARNIAACAPLQRALTRGAVTREYLAVVTGVPAPATGVVTLRIGPAPAGAGDRRSPVQRCYPEGASAGLPARTYYQTLRTLPASGKDAPGERTLLQLTLETGRTHQIRTHMAAIGHPLLGDPRYGGPPAARLFLHAARLRLRHPRTRQHLLLESPLPPEFPERPGPAQPLAPPSLSR